MLNLSRNIYKYKKRLDHTLVLLFPEYSRSFIKKSILNGNITVNEKNILTPDKKIYGTENIIFNAIFLNNNIIKAEPIQLNVIYEDKWMLVINKPANLVVHPGAGNPNGTLLNALLYHYPYIKDLPRMGIIHRLDKNTTGLIIIAKTCLTQIKLNKLLKERKITRKYIGIVFGKMISGGTINAPISRHPVKRTHMSVNFLGKKSVTHFRIIKKFQYCTILNLKLETGRTHQIRVHMAYIKHPLLGDNKYGNINYLNKLPNNVFKIINNFKRQALHAYLLSFNHPITSIKIKLKIKLPQDMLVLINFFEKN